MGDYKPLIDIRYFFWQKRRPALSESGSWKINGAQRVKLRTPLRARYKSQKGDGEHMAWNFTVRGRSDTGL